MSDKKEKKSAKSKSAKKPKKPVKEKKTAGGEVATAPASVHVSSDKFETLLDRLRAGKEAFIKVNNATEVVEMRDGGVWVRSSGVEVIPVVSTD